MEIMKKISEQQQENSQKFISQLLSEIQEAQSVLRYTLQIPYTDQIGTLPDMPGLTSNQQSPTKFLNELNSFIDSICNSILKDCFFLFNYGDSNIFGYKENNCSDLSVLSLHSHFWEHAFKQDMLLSAFVKLRKIIGENIILTTYQLPQFSNFTNDAENEPNSWDNIHHGLDYLTGWANAALKPYLNIVDTEDTFTIKKNQKPTLSSDDTSSKAPNHYRRIKNIEKKLRSNFNTQALYLYPYKTQNRENRLKALSVFEFYQFMVYQNYSALSYSILPIINSHEEERPFSTSTYKKYSKSISNLLSSITIEPLDRNIHYETTKDTYIEHRLSLSDKIYLRYQIEKVFSPIMIDCMYENIEPTIKTTFALDDKATINRLSSCLCLPNVFTRQYIFQMAIDTIIKHNDKDFGDSDFFTIFQKDHTSIMNMARPKVNYLAQQNKLSIWLGRYCNFVNYLAHMLLPVYENYFFVLLWDAVCKKFPEKSKSQCIIYLYELLRYFFNNEDCVTNLLSTEDIILSSQLKNYKLKPEHILHPSFARNDVNTQLYQSCLLSQNLLKRTNPVPDFLNLQYLNSFAAEASKYIQSYYICNFIS